MQVELKNPLIAGVLAFLIPGAGHLYQGRFFKAAIYSVCILGTFFWGMHLGQWKIVYQRWDSGNRNLGFLSQVLVGLPALPAYFQARRYTNQREIESKWERRDLLSPNETQLSAPFEGVMPVLDDEGNEVPQPVSGEITLEQVAGRFNSPEVRGIFTGSVNGQMGQTLAVRLDQIGPKIFADPLRTVACDIVDERDGSTVEIGHLKGTVPRSVWDWYEVPVEDATLQTLNKDLGRFFELAQVFTWIAGLLNLLAIWDALEGPAYGYGNELTGSNPGSAENAAGVSATKSPSVESQEAASRLGRAGEQKATVTPPTTGTTAVAATIR